MPLQQLFQSGDVIKARVLRTRQGSATAGLVANCLSVKSENIGLAHTVMHQDLLLIL